MTYKLEPWIGKIESPLVLLFPDGTERRYKNGAVAVADSLDKHYVVKMITADAGEIVITLTTVEAPSTIWIGEEQVGFF